MVDINQLKNDPKFQALAPAVQRNVLGKIAPGFGTLDPAVQDNVLGKLIQAPPHIQEPIPAQPIEAPRQTFPGPMGSVTRLDPITGDPAGAARTQEGKERISRVARPLLQGGGATVGAIAGAPLGPASSVVGGGLLFAVGDELADLLDQFMGLKSPQPLGVELTEAGKNVAIGFAWEMGGQIPGALLKVTVPALKSMKAKKLAGKQPTGTPITTAAAKQKAGKVLAANTSNGPLIAKNTDDAKALEDAIPGLKFSWGQLTDDPSIIKFERATAREPGNFAAAQREQVAQNTVAIREFINKQKGAGVLEDVTTPLAAQKQAAEVGVEAAGRGLEAEASILAGGPSPVAAGQIIREEAKKGVSGARQAAGALFKDVPDANLDAGSLAKKAIHLKTPFTKFEAEGNIPEILEITIKNIEESGGKISVDDLQGLGSELKEQIRDISKSASPNNRKLSRLTGLLDEVENVLGTAGKDTSETLAISSGMGIQIDTPESLAGIGARKLKTATTFFRKEVINKFKKGAVGDILRGEDKIENAQVASRLFKPGPPGEQAAGEFVKALGDNPAAREALESAINQNLLANATNPLTGEITEMGLNRWLKKHSLALNKLGLKNKFNSLLKARKQLDEAIQIKTSFDKSSASKLLGADVDKAIQAAFASGPKRQAAVELMKKIGINKQAVSGLQNSMIDHIISRAETTAADAFGNPIISVAKLDTVTKEFYEAMKVVFRDTPVKIKALNRVRDAVRTLQRTSKSPLGGGSDSAENIITSLSKASGISGNRLMTLARAFILPLKNMSDQQVNSLINRALLDPDFAYTLMAASSGAPPEIIKRRIGQHLATLGLVATSQIKGEHKYGTREDGTIKGPGFLGTLKRPDGKVSTELSIGVDFDGKETLIPSLVPTLNQKEIDHMLSGKKVTREIVNKAVEHARKRMRQGKSPFLER